MDTDADHYAGITGETRFCSECFKKLPNDGSFCPGHPEAHVNVVRPPNRIERNACLPGAVILVRKE